jgi:hypothetical protein
MTNLNIIQEINKQVTNFNHTQIHTGLDIITLMLPTLVATEFNQMVRDWKRAIRRDINLTLTEISDDVQDCSSIQSSVTNPDTYSFITKPKETQYARVNNASTNHDHHDRSNSKHNEQQNRYTEEDIRSIKDKAYQEGKASTHHTTHRDRSYTRSESQPPRQGYNNEKKVERDQQTPETDATPETHANNPKKSQRQKQKQKQKQRTFHADTTVISENQRPNPHTPTTTNLQHQSMTRRESTRTPHQNYSRVNQHNPKKRQNGTNNR